jgi:hypothetical protein
VNLELPPTLARALAEMASEPQCKLVLSELHATLREPSDPDDDTDFNTVLTGAVGFGEGTEKFSQLSFKDACAALGIPETGIIPGFNPTRAKEGRLADPWTDHAFFADKENVEDLRPKWHQLIGMIAMLDRIFDGIPVLQMDEVGVGKTVQAFGVVALLAHFRRYRAEFKDYPGYFSKHSHSTVSHPPQRDSRRAQVSRL